MTMTRSKNSTFELCICGRFMISGRTIFFQGLLKILQALVFECFQGQIQEEETQL
jgi:hypothetical protein